MYRLAPHHSSPIPPLIPIILGVFPCQINDFYPLFFFFFSILCIFNKLYQHKTFQTLIFQQKAKLLLSPVLFHASGWRVPSVCAWGFSSFLSQSKNMIPHSTLHIGTNVSANGCWSLHVVLEWTGGLSRSIHWSAAPQTGLLPIWNDPNLGQSVLERSSSSKPAALHSTSVSCSLLQPLSLLLCPLRAKVCESVCRPTVRSEQSTQHLVPTTNSRPCY